MGAYLSQPKTEKVSTDEFNNYLAVGASSMQGWRNSQEDAHNSILNFDKDTAFFAVYDGHGGAEVSTYCADKLPEFLKALSAYKNGKFERALIDAFLGFDKTLLEPHVIEILKFLAGEKNFVDGDDSDAMEDDEDEDLAELHEEGSLPLDEVMEKYKGHPSMPTLKKLKDSNSSKPQSPYLRGRRAAAVIADAANKAELDPESKPEGSSTSKAALAALQEDGPSSSKSSSSSGNKMETEEDSTVSSSSSSASKNNTNNSLKNAAEAEAVSAVATTTEKAPAAAPVTNGKATVVTSPDSSAVKENEQNGSVSSSEVKKIVPSTSSTTKEYAVVSGSSDANKTEHKQNGNVESSTKVPTKKEATSSAITSTSKEQKSKKKSEIEEDDEDDDANESNARQALEYSSEDEEDLGEDDTTDEDADYDDDDEEVEEEDEVEDEESYLANEQFCANMIEEPGKDSGCTAVVGLLFGRDLYVANAGDSRCVVSRNGKAIEMSLDHKPEDDEESARIIKAGGRVTLDGRVNGGLNLSRALGDHAYKMNQDLPAEEQMISALPDIKKLIISPEDEFMVLACDGIWNFMSSEEVVDFVRLRLKDENKKMSEICEELFDACLAPNTLGDGTGCDNMTAVIVRFKPSILELPTKLDPTETEEVLLTKQQAETSGSGQKALKRAASPTSDDNDSNKAESKTKKMKTDDEDKKTSSSSSKSTDSTDAASTTSTTTTATSSDSSTTAYKAELEKECDSVASST